MSTRTCGCGQPTSGAWLCPRCATKLKWAIVNCGYFYADLNTIAARQTNTSAGNNSGHRDKGESQPLPIDMRFVNTNNETHTRPTASAGTQLKWDTWATIVAWTRVCMEEQPPTHGPTCTTCLHLSCAHIRRTRWPRNTIGSMTHYLARQHSWILKQHWADTLLDELLNLEHRLKHFADNHVAKVLVGACLTCGAVVYAKDGETTATCTTPDCGQTYDVQASRDGLEQTLDNDLMTAAEIATHSMRLGLHVTREQVRKAINQWHRRGTITNAGHLKGDPLFRYGDVKLHLARRYATPPEQAGA